MVLIRDYFKEALKRHFFWTSIACLNREVFEDVGRFNEHYNRGEDLDLWARIGLKYNIVKWNQITAIYRLDAENRSDKISFDIRKSYLSDLLLNKKGIKPNERKYYRKLLILSFKRFLKKGEYNNSLFILKKILQYK